MELNQDTDRTTIYEIRIKNHLDCDWSAWLEGLTITLEADGDTLLRGPICDQSALYGLLKRIHDMGLQLIAINQVKATPTDMKTETGQDAPVSE